MHGAAAVDDVRRAQAHVRRPRRRELALARELVEVRRGGQLGEPRLVRFSRRDGAAREVQIVGVVVVAVDEEVARVAAAQVEDPLAPALRRGPPPVLVAAERRAPELRADDVEPRTELYPASNLGQPVENFGRLPSPPTSS